MGRNFAAAIFGASVICFFARLVQFQTPVSVPLLSRARSNSQRLIVENLARGTCYSAGRPGGRVVVLKTFGEWSQVRSVLLVTDLFLRTRRASHGWLTALYVENIFERYPRGTQSNSVR